MKCLLLFLIVLPVACSRPMKNEKLQEPESNASDTLPDTETIADEPVRDYHPLYGIYAHDSNTRGFTAMLEIIPQGNDLSFALSLLQGNCQANLTGTIGMVYHGQEEYAGFFESEACRLAFNFFLTESQIRIDEIGVCRVHSPGCSFGGVYVKKKTAD